MLSIFLSVWIHFYTKIAEMPDSMLEDGELKVYFTHTYSSCERGANECNNYMLRRFIPNGKSVSDYSANDICFFVDCINGLPRKFSVMPHLKNYSTASSIAFA